MIDQEIARRMDAYRGNPQALAQRYQMSQNLLDLLALQKIKSEKEAAARDMQLQMSQNQPQGGLPTVAQQREQEVMSMTKQELAQQVGGALQQQGQQKQAAFQKLMSGLAGAPGAANVMPPQAMAAGGIVAFQAGGTPEDAVTPMSEEEERRLDELDEIHQLESDETRRLMRRYPAEPARTRAEAKERMQGPYYGLTPSEREAAKRRQAAGLAQVIEQLRPKAALDITKQPEEVEYLKKAQEGERMSLMPSAFRPSPEEVRSQMQGGLRGLVAPPQGRSAPPNIPPSAGPTQPASMPRPAPQAAPPSDFEVATRAGLLELIKQDPEKYRKMLAEQFPRMYAEDRAAREKAIADAEARMAAEFNPESQRLDRLIQFLAGASGRSSVGGALAGGARAATSYDTAQRAAERERAKEIETMREGLRRAGEAERLGAFQAGAEGLKTGVTERGRSLETAGGVLRSDIAADAQRLATEAKQVENALRRRELDDRSAEGAYNRLTSMRAKLIQDISEGVEKQYAQQLMLASMKPSDPKSQEILRSVEIAKRQAILTSPALQETDASLKRLAARLGDTVPSAAAPAPAQAPVDTRGFRITSVR